METQTSPTLTVGIDLRKWRDLIMLYGPPGAGKETQATPLKKYGWIHISTGDLCRAELKSGSERGLAMKASLALGDLVDDAIIIELVTEYLDTCKGGLKFILDGFPRTIEQASKLGVMLANRRIRIQSVVVLDVSKKEVVRRLLERGAISPNPRPDDLDESVIENRYHTYQEETLPVLDFYTVHGTRIERVNGELGIDEIHDEVVQKM